MTLKDIIKKKIFIECRTEEEYKLCLQVATNENMKWMSGESPMEGLGYWDNTTIYLRFQNNKLGYTRFLCIGETSVLVKDIDFSEQLAEKYYFEIKQKNRKIIATLHDRYGNFVKSGKAVCLPEDEFNYEIGKKIALQRLFNMTPKNSEPNDNQKIFVLKDLFGKICSIVGQETELEAFGKIKLYTGDVVEVFNSSGVNIGWHCVGKNNKHNIGFIMGIPCFDFKNGMAIDMEGNTWLIVKKRSYKDMQSNDAVDGICYTLVKPDRAVIGDKI